MVSNPFIQIFMKIHANVYYGLTIIDAKCPDAATLVNMLQTQVRNLAQINDLVSQTDNIC